MEVVQDQTKPKISSDWLGVACSVGCAIHCAAMPVLLSLLPTITAVRWMADPLFHQVVAVVCAIIVVLAILPAWRKHRSQTVAGLAGAGIGLLFVAAFVLPDQCCSVDHTSTLDRSSATPLSPTARTVGLPASEPTSSGQTQLAVFTISKEEVGSETGCADDCVFCRQSRAHEATYSRPLFTADQLEARLGDATAQRLLAWQPFLSPLGGCLLILGHLVNIRLRACGCSGGCGSNKHT